MAWARVQSAKTVQTVAGPTTTATFGGTPTTGNKLIAWITLSSGGPNILSNVKDGAGNSLTSGMTPINNSGSCWIYMYFMDAPASPSTTVVVTWSVNATDVAIVIQEVSGLLAGNTTACLDGTTAGTAGSASPTGTGAYSSTALNEYLGTICGDFGNSATMTQPTGYTLDVNSANTTASGNCCVAYKNSTNGAEADSWSYSPTSGNQWAIAMVAFKLAAGGVAAATVSPIVMPGLASIQAANF